ncbi:peptide-methionine (S)-S-oxide reductase MsrA [Gordonia liuliyuniae]|uniref:Peptide methionine sulfoxide reductase MsrA n=1 Tax=Gordonia liuliyuniae TaxID=2911517 RepID=A0ABS9INX5_9ACTN|nr:peptide-methionine (S)-S-oxide reductase MsrA [Gordonia liuliyuniae]MCF8587266.1 peptide-methionine (S)-S-oxide reductase MsrA [Gordonia liuliyuniae]
MSIFDRLLAASAVKTAMVPRENALPGRDTAMPLRGENLVTHRPMRGTPDATGGFGAAGIGEWGPDLQAVVLAGGCFWGIEEIFWQQPGVYTTAVGYAGGYTPNPTYEEVCTAQTGHTESALIVFDPAKTTLKHLIELFFTSHDPTQEMRQGNDVGTQYRSAVFGLDGEATRLAVATAERYEPTLRAAGYGPITTEIVPLAEAGDGHFYYAEDVHQQYLFTNPNGYRCHVSTGLAFDA